MPCGKLCLRGGGTSGLTCCDQRTNDGLAPGSNTGGLESPRVPMRRWNNRPRHLLVRACQHLWLVDINGAFRQFTSVGRATEPNPSTAIDAGSRENSLTVVFPSRRIGCIVAAAFDQTVTSFAGAARLPRTEPRVQLCRFLSHFEQFPDHHHFTRRNMSKGASPDSVRGNLCALATESGRCTHELDGPRPLRIGDDLEWT